MRKKLLLSFLIAVIFCVAACNLGKNSEVYKKVKASKDYVLPIEDEEVINEQVEEYLIKFTPEFKEEYKVEKLQIEGVQKPKGILCREQDILITDSKNDILAVIDFDGNVIRKIGTTGNGPLEFMSPGEIVRYENKIYIIDEKNYRVQILDENLNYLEEIKTMSPETNDPHFVYQKIAVSKNGVYLNGFSFTNDQVHLYTKGIEKPIKIGKNFVGPLFNYNEKIYAANTLSKSYDKKTDTLNYGGGGVECLLTVNEQKKDFDLEYHIMQTTNPTSFVVNEKGIIALSAANSCFFIFGADGTYETSIAKMEGLGKENFPNFSVDNTGTYYVAAPENGVVFRCSLEK